MLVDGLRGRNINLMGRADSIKAWLEQRMQHSSEVVFLPVATPSPQKLFARIIPASKFPNIRATGEFIPEPLCETPNLCRAELPKHQSHGGVYPSNLCRAEPAPFAPLVLGVSP